MSLICWWETGDPQISLEDHAVVVKQIVTSGRAYRADLGAIPPPTGADVGNLFDVCRNLEDRIVKGDAYTYANPTSGRARYLLALLRLDYNATLNSFLAALALYEAHPSAYDPEIKRRRKYRVD